MRIPIQCCLDFGPDLNPDLQNDEASKADCARTIAATRRVAEDFLQSSLRRQFPEAYEQGADIKAGFKSGDDGALLSVNIFVPFVENMAEAAGVLVEILCLRLIQALPIYKGKLLVTIGPERAPANAA